MILGLIDEAVHAGARRSRACEVLGLSERTVQRWLGQGVGDDMRAGPHTEPRNKLSAKERADVIQIACSPEFREMSPWQIVPKLADRGVFIASESTMYRVLREEDLVNHRSRTKTPRPSASKPKEKVATGPCQLWSWDITYLPGPVAGQFFYLYMIMDVWSRKIIDYAIHISECAQHASALIERACAKEGITPDQLILHSDNGSPMKGATMLVTLQRLGVATSFSRPRVSDDNPYSESLFRTAKTWHGSTTRRFASLEDALEWAASFVQWYNHEHLHSAIRFVTPADRHAGRHEEILARRQRTFEAARREYPERFNGPMRSFDPVAVVAMHPGDDSATEVA